MSGLGVPDTAFFRLQESMMQRLAEMLINERQAALALSQVNSTEHSVYAFYQLAYRSRTCASLLTLL